METVCSVNNNSTAVLFALCPPQDDEAPPAASFPSDSELSAPLIVQSKTAGIRDSGFVFAPRKSWWIGLALVVLSMAVFTNTIVTAVIKNT